MEFLLRGHPDDRPTSLESPNDNVNLNRNVLIFTPDPSGRLYFCYKWGGLTRGVTPYYNRKESWPLSTSFGVNGKTLI